MHKIHSKVFEREDFSCDHMDESTLKVLDVIIEQLEALRGNFNETKDKVYWYSMIQLLPSSYNQMRTCTMTYENLRNMYHARKNHKLEEYKKENVNYNNRINTMTDLKNKLCEKIENKNEYKEYNSDETMLFICDLL